MRPRYMSQVSTYVLGVVGNLLHLRVSLRCHGDARPMLLLLAVSGARKAVATDTALVHTARYARASRAIAVETDGTTRPGTTKTRDPTEEGPAKKIAAARTLAIRLQLLSSCGEIATCSPVLPPELVPGFRGFLGSWIEIP